MLDTMLSFIAPHHCSGCGVSGTLLCDNCEYDIIADPYSACVACGRGIAGRAGLCGDCHPPYDRAWCVAPRLDHVEQLLNTYKFHYTKAAHRPLASLLHEHLPELPPQVRLVPVPTINSHIRQRGYDHTLLIAKALAKKRGLLIDTSLQRATSTMQRGANARTRTAQAKRAFRVKAALDPDAVYLLLDDVITTGATVKYATKALKDAGAQYVWVVAICRQPLD